MLSGDNSILNKASETKNKTDLEGLKEEIKIIMSERQINKSTGAENLALREELEQKIQNSTVELVNELTDVCYVSRNGIEITVYENGDIVEGKISIWKGKQNGKDDIDCPKFEKNVNNVWDWYIYNAGQLKFLANYVNNGNTFTEELSTYATQAGYNVEEISFKNNETTVYLMNNLDMGARKGAGSTEEAQWEREENENLEWTPIGSEFPSTENAKSFIGIFDGKNNSIRNVYINQSENDFVGLFGCSNSVRNLSITNSYIRGKESVGGISGASYTEMYNCQNNNAIVVGNRDVGGIVGSATSGTYIENCNNNGRIKCIDTSDIFTQCFGGIVGQLSSRGNKYIKNCKNTGNIGNEKTDANIGGIAGNVIRQTSIIGCVNEGKIEGEQYIGGISGTVVNNSTISDCKNYGEILKKSNVDMLSFVGGIVGIAGVENNPTASNITITGCNNSGRVKGSRYIGGISGAAMKPSTVTKCENSGNISGTQNVGGINGISLGNTTECINKGSIEADIRRTGGINGTLGESSFVKKCLNTAKVVGKRDTAGIVGVIIIGSEDAISQVDICYNSGEINGDNNTGGIVGNVDIGEVKECYNKGMVNGRENIGEIIGRITEDTIISKLFYLRNNRGLNAISGENDDLTKKINVVDDDLTSEQFITWIEEQ